MISVGVDVSKGKSTVAILQPLGLVVAAPYDVFHTDSELDRLAKDIKKLPGETKVVMEATGVYFEPIARRLHEHGIFVSVVNPMLISDFGGNTLRKAKTDKKDALRIARYALEALNIDTPKPLSVHKRRVWMLAAILMLGVTPACRKQFCKNAASPVSFCPSSMMMVSCSKSPREAEFLFAMR